MLNVRVIVQHKYGDNATTKPCTSAIHLEHTFERELHVQVGIRGENQTSSTALVRTCSRV